MSTYASNDIPPTDAELNACYGAPISEDQRNEAIGAASSDVDFAELTDALFDHEEAILDAIANNDASNVGELIMLARRERIASLAGRRIGCNINASEVKL